MFPPGRKRRRRRASSPALQTDLQKKRKINSENLGRREARELREVWGKVGRGAECQMVELKTAWNILKTSLQFDQAS